MSELYHQLDLFQSMPFPAFPLCAHDPRLSGSFRAPLDYALTLPYIQANPKKRIWVLLFDVDREYAALAWDDAGLPEPTWTSVRASNGHAHIAYMLKVPVAKSDLARLKPLRLLARIEHAMTVAMDADRGYSKSLTKNPVHDDWHTKVWRDEPYTLDELRDYLPDDLPMPIRVRKEEASSLFRNVWLFENLRQWAYSQKRHVNSHEELYRACLSKAMEMNTFQVPLPYSELKSTAKSIAKWTWVNFDVAESDEKFSRLQKHRNKLSVASRRAKLIDLQAELLK